VNDADAKNRRVKLRDLAASLEVSVATVSMALRNDPRVAPATRQKVRAMAAEMGYERSPYVSALMAQVRRGKTGGRGTLALVDCWAGRQLEQVDGFRQLLRGIEREASSLGYLIERFVLNRGERCVSQQRLLGILEARGIPGLLIPPIPVDWHWERLPWDNLAVVAMSKSQREPPFDRVVQDHSAMARQSVQWLYQEGYERPCLLIDESGDDRLDRGWTGGFVAGLKTPESFPGRLLRMSEAEMTNAEEVTRRFRALNADALVTKGYLADALRLNLAREEWESLKVVLLEENSDSPCAAVVDQRNGEVGAQGVRMLVHNINTHRRGIPEVRLTMTVEPALKVLNSPLNVFQPSASEYALNSSKNVLHFNDFNGGSVDGRSCFKG
jgi:LacI family fructose operon transcriptional repressor